MKSHINNLLSLMPDVDIKMAKEVLDALESDFAKKDGMHKVLTKQNL